MIFSIEQRKLNGNVNEPSNFIIMALNTLHNVTLSEAQISIILYTLEDYMSSDRKSNDPDLESDVDSIFQELEGTIDRHYDKIEKARKKQPEMEW